MYKGNCMLKTDGYNGLFTLAETESDTDSDPKPGGYIVL